MIAQLKLENYVGKLCRLLGPKNEPIFASSKLSSTVVSPLGPFSTGLHVHSTHNVCTKVLRSGRVDQSNGVVFGRVPEGIGDNDQISIGRLRMTTASLG